MTKDADGCPDPAVVEMIIVPRVTWVPPCVFGEAISPHGNPHTLTVGLALDVVMVLTAGSLNGRQRRTSVHHERRLSVNLASGGGAWQSIFKHTGLRACPFKTVQAFGGFPACPNPGEYHHITPRNTRKTYLDDLCQSLHTRQISATSPQRNSWIA